MHHGSVTPQRRSRKWLGGGVALALAVFAGSTAANATVFGGSATFYDYTTGNQLTVTADPNPKTFNTVDLTAPNDQYFAGFMGLSTQDTQHAGLGCIFGCTQADQVALKFSWSQPSAAADTVFGGEVAETVFVFHFLDTGALLWDNIDGFDLHGGLYASQTVYFSNGAEAEVDVYDTLLAGSSTALGARFDVRIRDIKDAPEPASIALLGAGLLGTGLIRRRRKG